MRLPDAANGESIRPRAGMTGDLIPENAQMFQTVIRPIAGDDCGVDCADRNPGHPIGQIFRRSQCLVNPGLVAAKRAPPCKTKPTFLS